jgi:hypothetical protein
VRCRGVVVVRCSVHRSCNRNELTLNIDILHHRLLSLTRTHRLGSHPSPWLASLRLGSARLIMYRYPIPLLPRALPPSPFRLSPIPLLAPTPFSRSKHLRAQGRAKAQAALVPNLV